jgi:hypothetical protein
VRIRFQAAPVCPSDCGTQTEHTDVAAAVTSIGRAVGSGPGRGGATHNRMPARALLNGLGRMGCPCASKRSTVSFFPSIGKTARL